ncbi:MAG: Fic family protein [Chloroflexi bacterium]|nr:Fic family protein [Chloroflexota bacterium]
MRYPTLDEVLTLHQLVLDAHGGSAGLRDMGALQSALAAPRQTMFGEELYPGIADKSAIILYLLTQNHPFVDGNKRTAPIGLLPVSREQRVHTGCGKRGSVPVHDRHCQRTFGQRRGDSLDTEVPAPTESRSLIPSACRQQVNPLRQKRHSHA